MGLLDPVNVLGESNIDVMLCTRCPARTRLRTLDRAPFTVVLDSEDNAAFTRTALRAHDPMAGRVVVHPTVAASDRPLWHDILRALADTADQLARTGNMTDPQREEAVLARLREGRVRQLTVLRAHRIRSGKWADLVHLHIVTGVDLVLVHHAPLPDDLAHLLRHCWHRRVTTQAGMRPLYSPAAAPGV